MSDGNGDRGSRRAPRRTTTRSSPRPGGPPDAAASGPAAAPACPAERSKDFGVSVRRLGTILGTETPRLVGVGRAHRCQRHARRPRAAPARPGHRHHRERRVGRRDRLRRPPPQAVARRRDLPGVVGPRVLAGLHPRRGAPALDVRAARIGRAQDQPAAAQLHRPPGPRRPAEPGHQRHRQPRPEPAADDQPDPHVAAHARRRDDHDVHDLAAVGGDRADHRAAVDLADEVHRWARPAALHGRSGATPAASTPRPRK